MSKSPFELMKTKVDRTELNNLKIADSELISSSLSKKSDGQMKLSPEELLLALDGKNMHKIRRPALCPLPNDQPCQCLINSISQSKCPFRPKQMQCIVEKNSLNNMKISPNWNPFPKIGKTKCFKYMFEHDLHILHNFKSSFKKINKIDNVIRSEVSTTNDHYSQIINKENVLLKNLNKLVHDVGSPNNLKKYHIFTKQQKSNVNNIVKYDKF